MQAQQAPNPAGGLAYDRSSDRSWTAALRRGMGSSLGLRIISFVSMVALWAVLAAFFPPTFLPGPERVFQKLIKIVVNENFLTHASSTVARVLVGFVLALLGSAGIGMAMGINSKVERFLDTYVLVGLSIPGLCWAILALMWFGISEAAPVFAIAVIVSPMIAVNMWQGTKAIDRELLELGQAFRTKRAAVVWEIILPQLLPYVFAASRFGFALAWKVVVVSEMLGLSNGIGYMINMSFSTFSMEGVLGWTLSFTLLMIAFEFGVLRPVERHFTAWRPKIAI